MSGQPSPPASVAGSLEEAKRSAAHRAIDLHVKVSPSTPSLYQEAAQENDALDFKQVKATAKNRDNL